MDETGDMSLRTLLVDTPEAVIDGNQDLPISGIECDSRRVGEGDLFVAIRGGEQLDRHEFVADAERRGAPAVVIEDETVQTKMATRVVVGDCRMALARLAARFYGYPAKALCMVGLTGTNGKTTTALLVREILQAAGRPCGYLGTLGALDQRGAWVDMPNTTPEASDLHQHLHSLSANGSEAVAMEVSSHALALNRVEGIEFEAAVFTNLTRDHLDFHGTEQAYFDSKARLFEQVVESSSPNCAINTDDETGHLLAGRLGSRVLTFGGGDRADVRWVGGDIGAKSSTLQFTTPRGSLCVHSWLTGRFNCANVMAAVACGLALEVEDDAIARGIAAVAGVRGRFERVDEGQSFEVIVDYAHTPAGLENILHSARELSKGKLICLFGCGGDRDRGKRALMGQAAEHLADLVFVTSDNPRSELPEKIIDDILAGMSSPAAVEIQADRRVAIAQALRTAEAGDVVVLAGKGDEAYQVLADEVIEFDDRAVAREALRAIAETR